MGLFVILLVIVVAVAAVVLVAIVTSVWGGERQLPPPPAPPVEIPHVRHPQLPQQTQPGPQPETQRRIKKRARHAESPVTPTGTKKIRLHKKIKTHRVGLSPKARCRVTRRPVLECGCDNVECRKLRAKYGV